MKFLASIVPLLVAALPLAAAAPSDPDVTLALREELVSVNETSWQIDDDFGDDDDFLEELSVGLDSEEGEGLETRNNGHRLHWHYRSKWVEYANQRYRTEFYVKPNTVKHHMEFCHSWSSRRVFVSISNFRCGWDKKLKIWRADVSYIQGPAGWKQYTNGHQEALNEWRRRTKGDVYQW